MKLKSLIPLQVLKEAEKDEKDTASADDAGADENPFAAAGSEDAGDETPSADGDEEGGEEGGEEAKEVKPLLITFNVNKAKLYNKNKINGSKGTVVDISKKGLTVKMPDERLIFVNFDDII